MFTLVNYVCLSQGYIRGRFVLKQWQFLIGRAASVQIKWSLSLWFVSSVREICLLCFVNSELTTWLHFIKKWLWLLQVRRPVIKYFLNSSGQFTIKFLVIKTFCFFWQSTVSDLWVTKSNSFQKTQRLFEFSLYCFDFCFDKY